VGSYPAVSVQPEERSGDQKPTHPLLVLQDIDLSIDRLTARLVALESHDDVRQARLGASGAEDKVGELRLAVNDVATEQQRLENDIDSVSRKIEAERGRLFDGSVANPKELQAIDHEVASLRERKSRMEDMVLERMERREELEAQLALAEADAAEARTRLAEIEATSARELVELERALGERKAERAATAPQLDEEVVELYEELRPQKKGIGAAALVDGVCQGCHQKLSPMYLDRLKRVSGTRRCEYCRRILV
jgi:predicted  nucleic acid-binding Zn-ribbon protein